MPLTRRVLLYFFVLVYLFLCPWLILYSFGYILRPGSPGILQTGLVYLASVPPGAQVYLERRRFSQRTPAAITELYPGAYNVSVRLRGYRTWDHRVAIEAGKAAAFENIILLPLSSAGRRVLPATSPLDIIPLRSMDSFLVKRGPRLGDLYVFDPDADRVSLLINKGSVQSVFPVRSVLTQPASRSIIVSGGSMWGRRYLLVDPEEKNGKLKDMAPFISGRPDLVAWTGETKNEIYIVHDELVDRMDVRSMALDPGIVDGVKGFGAHGSSFYVLGKDNSVSRYSREMTRKLLWSGKGAEDKELFSRSRFYRIQVLDKDLLLFWGDKGDLVTTVPPYRIEEGGVLGFDRSPALKKVLYWTRNSIGTIETFSADTGVAPEVSVRKDVLYDGGREIGPCTWVYRGSHVLFKDRADIYLLEISPDGMRPVELLAHSRESADFYYSDDHGVLYFIGPAGDLEKLEIVPGPERS